MTREFGAPQSAPAQPGEQTRVFNGAAPAEEDEIGQTKPVTMHSDEIAGLLEKMNRSFTGNTYARTKTTITTTMTIRTTTKRTIMTTTMKKTVM
ncbi:hypothetical protein [Allobaculum sp. Allo2]|uniref:hypothetical protein n=1 Tax=Allobaculum sp. Allo2 TaxID=2853432 RepID=UPI001F600DA5|nr:hypothetical protein [Allobaculum sp. Allo2]UNT93607.1 hypothetical protein KWG61_02165 [Allobaculum sp. Allo2]